MAGSGGYYDLNYAAWLPDAADGAILDIGCGEGDFVRYAAGRGHRDITAVDIDAQALARLAEIEGVTTITAPADGDFVRGLGRRYRLIVVKQMIYYLTRREAPAFVAALRDALEDDGLLVIEVFNGALMSARFTETKDPAIETAYTENSLRRLLEWNGLAVIEMFGIRTPSRGAKSALYRLLQRAWFRLYRALMVLERGRDDELPRLHHKSLIAVARR